MKRNALVATVAAAALVGGGTATALAVTGDDSRGSHDDARHTSGDSRHTGDDAAAAKSARVTAADAITAALRDTSGTAVSAELDDDGSPAAWEVDVLGKDGTWHSVRLDSAGGKVLSSHTEHEDGDDTAEARAALKGATTSAADAARAAAAHGTVTSIELDDDSTAVWEAETLTAKGVEKDWRVDAATGKVTADRSDDDGADDDASDDKGSDGRHSDDHDSDDD
ncbi:PepSY domain-containing protein [Streptomyces sp. NPDC059785]|uniref:PepSY domain-containing protein n=1 Tax=unclassified Streptomyces TaxID=2593676 RepID=UPI00364C303C